MAEVMSPATASGREGRRFERESSFCHVRLAVQKIAVALHQNVSRAQHVRQLAHLLRVFDRLIERLVEVVGAQNGEVCVIGFFIFIGMAVHDGEVVIVIFLADKAAGFWQNVRTLFLNGFG